MRIDKQEFYRLIKHHKLKVNKERSNKEVYKFELYSSLLVYDKTNDSFEILPDY